MFKSHAIRLKPGNDLKTEVENYVRVNNIRAGWIACCVGSLTTYNLRFANQSFGSTDTGHFEIVSMAGTVSINGSHLHMAIADSKGKMIGGHLLYDNIIYTTAEVILQEDDSFVFTREKDGTTRWSELQVKKNQ